MKLIEEDVLNNIEVMKSLFLVNKFKGSSGKGFIVDLNIKVLFFKVFEWILSIVKEILFDNLFKGEEVKFWNVVIFEVMEVIGMCVGEILGL